MIERLIRPRSIAVVGISAQPGSMGTYVLANLERCGFNGETHLVSRSSKVINGRDCIGTIEGLPSGIDAAVLAVPGAAVADALAACGRRGIGSAVVFASGFAELGQAGRSQQQELTRIARQAGVLMLGPNCMGLINLIDGAPLSFEYVEPHIAVRGPRVAVIAQSGAIASALRLALTAKGIGIAFAVSTGNEADLGAEDFLDFFVRDEGTRAAALFIEQIRQPREFLEIAERAREQGKPIIVMHPGKSQRARDSAGTHTGALAGDHAVTRALLAHRGVVMVDTLDELVDATDMLARHGPPTGGCGIVTNSGAIKGFALDFCDALGIDIAQPGAPALARLRQVLPPYAVVDNPVDVTAQGMRDPSIFTHTARALIDDPGIGSVGAMILAGSPKNAMEKAQALVAALSASPKPTYVTTVGDEAPLPQQFAALFHEHGIPFFRSPERALRALAHARDYGRMAMAGRHEPVTVVAGPAPHWRGAAPEYVAKPYLAALGIAVPHGALAQTSDAALAIAERIGFPVALKAQSRALIHKSDRGGVALALADGAAVARTFADMTRRLGQDRLDGVLVEAMVPAGVEMIVGARRDTQWGAVVIVGLGGIWVDALRDLRLLPPDLSRPCIIEEVRRLKGAAVLDGLRGAPACDIAALAEIVARVGALMQAYDEIEEIDINPLVVHALGVVALDAVVITRS
ncbi:MAG: acetate--CoA ligase family protein [Proteobacteria bacterium]|nr:acetate--CoA ligase family protein [Pseudomonadota bacterium]